MTQLNLVENQAPRFIDFPEKFEVGQRIYCGLYGGTDGTIIAIHGEQKPETIKVTGGFIHSGGNCEIDVAWDNGGFSRRTPECIARGVQWKMLSGYRDPQEAILESQAYIDAKEEEARLAKIAFAKAVEDVKDEFSFLTIDDGSDNNIVQKNMRTLLRKQFPGIKFKVTKDGYSARNVAWTDGPTEKAVQEFVYKFQAGNFNGMEDIYEYNESPFNKAFGGVQYVFTRREFSDEFYAKAIDATWEEYGHAFEEYEKPTIEQRNNGLGSMYSKSWRKYFTDFMWETLSKMSA